MATNSCGNPPDDHNCSTGNYPWVNTHIFDGGSVASNSLNAANNYNIVWAKNTSASTKTYSIKLWLSNWNSVSSAYYAVAWVVS